MTLLGKYKYLNPMDTHLNTLAYKRRQSLLSQKTAGEAQDKSIPKGYEGNVSQKAMTALNDQLESERNRREELQKELQQWKRRLMERETELRGVISKIQQDKDQAKDFPSSKARVPNFLLNIHGQINTQIDSTNSSTLQYFQTKQKLNIQHMQRRLDALKKEMEHKASQQKSVTMEVVNFQLRIQKVMMAEIEDVRSMAIVIDNQNKKLLQEVKELRIMNKVLGEERNIAINENVMLNLKVKEVKRANQALQSERNSSRGRPFSNNTKGQNMRHSLAVSQQLSEHSHHHEKNMFIGEPIFDSPKTKPSPTRKAPPTELRKSLESRQQRSILSLQRTLKREKKKNFQICTLFAQNSKKNNEINEILWQSMEKARQEVVGVREGEGESRTFHTSVVENILKSEEVFKTIERIRGSERLPERGRREKYGAVDLSELQEMTF